MYALVDNDPYGLSIYGVYKYGGGERASAWERTRLALPRLQFLGIRAGDFGGDEGVIALTERDRGKVEGMLEKKWVCDEPEILYFPLWVGSDCRGELLWMKRVDGKREIEAVCEFWEDGIVGYLYHKLSQELEVARDTDEINFTELQDDFIMDEDMGIDLEDTVDDDPWIECASVMFHNSGCRDGQLNPRDGFTDNADDEMYVADGYEGDCDLRFNESDEEGSEIGFESMQDDLFNI
jgi:hypothetical protein